MRLILRRNSTRIRRVKSIWARLAPVELPRAAAELEARRQDLSIAVSTLRQQEASFKDQLTRIPDPAIEEAEIITLDRIQVPADETMPGLRDLYARAMAHRPDMAISKIKDQNSEIASIGTRDALLPTGIFYGYYRDRGAAGTPVFVPGEPTSPYFSGGYGKALGQVVRNDFPTEYGGFYFQAPIGNQAGAGGLRGRAVAAQAGRRQQPAR